MSLVKPVYRITLFIALTYFFFTCNNDSKTNSNAAASTKVSSDKTNTQNTIDPALEKLLTHFKERNGFPVLIDSIYITKAKKHDSLGGSQVKLIAIHWHHDDSLPISPEYLIKDFYTIDSVKANGGFVKWSQKLDIGMTKFSNAYALEKIKLNDSITVLLWALSYSSYEADPYSDGTNIYYTLMNRTKVGESFLLGCIDESGDPPSAGENLTTGKLTKDDHIVLEERVLVSDLDDMKGEITRTHYEYTIENTGIKFKTKKVSSTEGIKVKD